MNAVRTFELIAEYATCPECGSEKVGNGAGRIVVTDDTFLRECQCGWKVEITEDEAE